MGAARTSPTRPENALVVDDSSRQAEVERLRSTLGRIRDPAGAVRLAVQMLAGPLRDTLSHGPSEPADRVAEVLAALEASTAELTELLASCRAPARSQPAQEPLVAVPVSPPAVTVLSLFERVRAAVMKDCPLTAEVRFHVPSGLSTMDPTHDLHTALCGLLRNAIEASARKRPEAGPWQVELRAFVDAAEELGDELHLVFEVRDRGDGIPKAVALWATDPSAMHAANDIGGPGMSLRLARRLADGAGGRLSLRRVAGSTRVALRLPHPHVPASD